MAIAQTGTTGMLWQAEPGYEIARVAGWNCRVPDRFPDVIVRPTTDEEVAAALTFARSRGLRVAVRAGGHSMCGAALHDGGMLVDLAAFDQFTVDADSGIAVVQPAVTAQALAGALADQGLAFPVAHHGSVPISGFVLSGGLGWNIGTWGPACASLRGLEVVTADGARIVADDEQNSDLLWAARGAGPIFFGIATRFRLAVHTLPAAIRTSFYVYPLADVEVVSRWAAELAPTLPPSVELLLLLASAPPGAPAGPAGKVVGVIATAFAATDQEATHSLALLETCPAAGRAMRGDVDQPASFDSLHAAIGGLLPARHRYCEESLWSDADLGALLPRLAERIVGAPSAKSVVLAAPLRPPAPDRPALDAAFSPLGRTFALCYGIWDDHADDAANELWLDELTSSCESFTAGRYIAETDISTDASKASRSLRPDALRRLRDLRRRYDPHSVFHTWPDVE